MRTFRSCSGAETKKLAKEIAHEIQAFHKKDAKKALVIALSGDLGAGKTTFAQGFLRALGVRGRIMSPTFIVFRRYPLRGKLFLNAFHIDAYRLTKEGDAAALELANIFQDPKNVILVEWPERIARALPRSMRRISFLHGKKEHERIISFR